MKLDMTFCKGVGCTLRNNCKRYVDGLEAENLCDVKPLSWVSSCEVEDRPLYYPIPKVTTTL